VLLHYGYDKTTMSDIAREADVAKSTIYRRWDKKDDLIQTLLWHEIQAYVEDWFRRIEADPQPGYSSFIRAALEALHASEFIFALYSRERHLLGTLLNHSNVTAFYSQSQAMFTAFLQEMQAIGAIRQDVDPAVVAYLAECLEYGYIQMGAVLPDDETPPTDAIIEGMVQMLERMIQPDTTTNPEAIAEIVRQYIQKIKAAYRGFLTDER
jgi:TetR/AcrR family acrAB operon transcriptional repressor